ncbi:MAG TPA: MarR family transcriptional regulator, partial [Ktedonobacterales bacterium]
MNTPTKPPIVPALERATHAVALWIERAFAEPRLSQAEAHVLAYLAVHAPCSINDLHHSFGHKRSTLTSLLDRLERRGWLRRAAHPTSRRLVLVELTDGGRVVAERVAVAMSGLEARLAARVGQGDAAAFLRVIRT